MERETTNINKHKYKHRLQPRYHFSSSEFFFDRPPYNNDEESKRQTRFISLADMFNAEKQKVMIKHEHEHMKKKMNKHKQNNYAIKQIIDITNQQTWIKNKQTNKQTNIKQSLYAFALTNSAPAPNATPNPYEVTEGIKHKHKHKQK